MESNGYIMLDFSMLDFSRHNQVIDGIYKRVFEIVGANKFVIILGADEKTPLPACVSFTNGSYVIESFLFNFVITGDDNVRIENVSSDIIKDGIISAGTTWSSSKIKDELDNKVNISSLSEVATTGSYDDLLNTPFIPININELDNVVLTTPEEGNVLFYDGDNWINNILNGSNIFISSSSNKTIAEAIYDSTPKVAILTSSMNCSYADSTTIGYRSTSSDIVDLSTLPNYPIGKTILGFVVAYAYVGNVDEYYKIAQLNIVGTKVYCNAKVSGLVRFGIRVIYI